MRKTELCVHSCVKPKNMHYDKKSKNAHASCVKKKKKTFINEHAENVSNLDT